MRKIRIGLTCGKAYHLFGKLHLFIPMSAGGYYDPSLRHLGPQEAYKENKLPYKWKFILL